MKVKAIGMGQYKNRVIERGQVFDIANDKEFSGRWMQKVEENKIEVPTVETSKVSDKRKPENAADREAIEEQLKAEHLGVTK